MDNSELKWVEYGTLGGMVAFNPSAEGEALVQMPIMQYGQLTGIRVECIIQAPNAEGGGAVWSHPVWDFLMEGALEAPPSTPDDSE